MEYLLGWIDFLEKEVETTSTRMEYLSLFMKPKTASDDNVNPVEMGFCRQDIVESIDQVKQVVSTTKLQVQQNFLLF
jgi:hypothetical protein